MPKVAKELSALAVGKLKEPGLHVVGGVPGLGLQVSPTGTRSWVMRVTIMGKRREMGLGPYPLISLSDARNKARETRLAIYQGADPLAEKQAAKRAETAVLWTFERCAAEYIKSHRAGWRNPKHAAQWSSTLERYAYPSIGHLPVADVDVRHVVAVLLPIWHTKTETASRVRGRIESVLDWASGRGMRTGLNAAAWKGVLSTQLPARNRLKKPVHHAALDFADAPAFMLRLRAAAGVGALALEFTILTAARSGEVRGAVWSEIDREAMAWTIPAERMKAGKEHRVPLSAAALAVLDRASKIPRLVKTDLVFPSALGGMLSDMTLSAVLRRMKVAAVPHGFRSTFRDWTSEMTNYPNTVAEMALAHGVRDKVEAAYRRGDLFEKRRAMMNDWADFLAGDSAKSAGDIKPPTGDFQ